VRYLRTPPRNLELAAVTGASAGAANAVMAAAMWCEDWTETRDDDPDENIFHDAWAPVGIEELLPDQPSGFTAADGLLSAAPLEKAIRRIRTRLLEQGPRFRPGCAVSIGLTVTRDRPQERQVGGVRAGTQRFVIPWRFEVDEQGRPSVVAAVLPPDRGSTTAQLLLGEPAGTAGIGSHLTSQAILASMAFPFAFRPRELCDCASSCPDENVVRDGSCDGPDHGERITTLSCDRFLPPGSRQLCRRSYIDGGIFDNAPVGLAVDLAEVSVPHPLPFGPITYLIVDPDYRRFAPSEPASSSGSGLAGPARLIANLVGTARDTELARSIRDERWERTTQSTLADAAQLQAEAVDIQEQMARIAGAGDDDRPTLHRDLLRSPRREALGWFLLRCLGDLRLAAERGADPETLQLGNCSGPLRDGTAGASDGNPSRLTPGQVVELAQALSAVFVASGKRAEQVISALSSAGMPLDRQLRLLALVHDISIISVTSYRFLIGEIPGIIDSDLSAAELLELRRILLARASGADRLLRATSAMLYVLVSAVLLEEGQGTLSRKAARALDMLASGRDPGMESEPVRSIARRSERVAGLVALAARLRSLTARQESIATSAAQLSASDAAERQLILSRRFSPLGGGQLLNFSGFLDRGLRELDFYLGVYDAAVQIAAHDCQIQGPYAVAGRPPPVFRNDAPLELDFSAIDTQRCLGQAMRTLVDHLQLQRSARVPFVIARLARLELAASLGSRSAADRLLQEPSWAWLGDPKLPPDQTGPALAAVTSRFAPCRPADKEKLCLADPTFDELLDALQRAGYRAQSGPMRDALAERERWAAGTTAALLDRAAAVELHSENPSTDALSETVLAGLGLGELWSRRVHGFSGGASFLLDPSTIPARPSPGAGPVLIAAAHLVPYRVSLEVARGGVAFSWLEPTLRLLASLSVDSIANVLDIDGTGKVSSTFGLMPTLLLGRAALGVGAQWTLPWSGIIQAPGVVGRIAWLQDRLAVTGGVRSLQPGHQQAVVMLSVSDLNGLLYWLGLWRAR
jgi:predicted acylesterase/phospholipase RssA